jgi:transcriptional regulator with XRE-family HTH domain
MDFGENLKSQLQYSGMLVKELAALSGVKKKTIDSYLGNKGYAPSVYAAVNIAKVLGVSVEYLITGKEGEKERPLSSLPKDIQEIILLSEQLKTKDRQIILTLARLLKDK